MKKISIIIPCYNYEKLILNNIIKLTNKLKEYQNEYEIIIVDDGSLDNTRKRIESILYNKKINLISNVKNQGKSFSVICALNKCKYENIILIDCDLPYFDYLDKIILGIENNFDLICVNRRSKESLLINNKLSYYQKTRYVIGNLIGKIINLVLKINFEGTDTQAGLKAFKKDNKFKSLKFFSKKYFFDLELIYHYTKKQKKILMVPVKYVIAEKSNIRIFSLKNFNILYELIKVLLILKFFKLN